MFRCDEGETEKQIAIQRTREREGRGQRARQRTTEKGGRERYKERAGEGEIQ